MMQMLSGFQLSQALYTMAEWRGLLEAGGFSLDRVIVSPSPFPVIEAALR